MSDGARAVSQISSNLTPEQATEALAKMAADYKGPPPDPNSPAGARAALKEKMADPAWYTRFSNGSAELREEFNQLTERGKGDLVDQVIAGTAPVPLVTGGGISNRDQMDSAAGLLADGIKPDQIKRLLNNEPVSRTEYETVLQMEREKKGDPEFVKRWLAGGAEEKRLMTLIGLYKVVGFKDEAA